MLSEKYLQLAQAIAAGVPITERQAYDMAHLDETHAFQLLAGADFLRQHHFGKKVHLCTILNAKSGRCSEDCSFCSQSVYATTDSLVYGLKSKDEIMAAAQEAEQGGIHRFSVVTSGKGLPSKEIHALSATFQELHKTPKRTKYCASLGVISQTDLQELYQAGVTRYHHNLEASESHYPSICTTHSYQERVNTIRAAKQAGMSVCAGGIFGIGESDAQAVEMALALRELDVDSVPLNFLMAVEGTKLVQQNPKPVTPLRAIKLIAIFRYILPNAQILICGGRIPNLKDLHALVFYAGASGIMTGNYLTRDGRTLQEDLDMIKMLGYEPEWH
jgi:biotin synthase